MRRLARAARRRFDGITRVASRTNGTEVESGLINVVILPMFVVSGLFSSSDRFPEALQPLVHALPLTALNDTLRTVILEGEPVSAQLARLAVLLTWGAVSFLLAPRFFRWNQCSPSMHARESPAGDYSRS